MEPSLKPVSSLDFTLPYHFYSPTTTNKLLLIFPISLDVLGKFLRPKTGVSPRHGGSFAAWMPVPEAAMDEQNKREAGQHNIRLTWQIGTIQPKSVTRGMEPTAHHKLRRRVFAMDPRHKSAPSGRDINEVTKAISHDSSFNPFVSQVKRGEWGRRQHHKRDPFVLGGYR